MKIIITCASAFACALLTLNAWAEIEIDPDATIHDFYHPNGGESHWPLGQI